MNDLNLFTRQAYHLWVSGRYLLKSEDPEDDLTQASIIILEALSNSEYPQIRKRAIKCLERINE